MSAFALDWLCHHRFDAVSEREVRGGVLWMSGGYRRGRDGEVVQRDKVGPGC